MTEKEAAAVLRTVLFRIRDRTAQLLRAVVQAEEEARADAARAAPRMSGTRMDATDASLLRVWVEQAMDTVRSRTTVALMAAMRSALTFAAQEWVDAHRALYVAVNRVAPEGVLASMLRSPDRILLPRFAGLVRTAPDTLIDANVGLSRRYLLRYLTLATGQVPSATAAESITRILQGRVPRSVAGFEQLRSMQQAAELDFRLLRVYTTELWDASRTGTASLAEESPLVYVVQWTLSVRHVHPDQCDALAGANSGYGPGWYRVGAVPQYPHPRCACYLGDVRVVPPTRW